ncbi:GreA/GreB family elongation factor [Pseudoalteromonas sp. ZZD1]|uniref:GreA/GreB family elongation factor n=1 Tax=Pseudoalteromonas sp. ZZD1 TaxID=3139395 RepID=UPI003BAA73F3
MFPSLFEHKKFINPKLKYKINLGSTAILLHPLKLAHLLQKVEYSERPWSKFSPHVQVNSTVVIRHTVTGYKYRITLVAPEQHGVTPNAVSFHSLIGIALLGHKVGHIFECVEGGVTHCWEIIAINVKEKI